MFVDMFEDITSGLGTLHPEPFKKCGRKCVSAKLAVYSSLSQASCAWGGCTQNKKQENSSCMKQSVDYLESGEKRHCCWVYQAFFYWRLECCRTSEIELCYSWEKAAISKTEHKTSPDGQTAQTRGTWCIFLFWGLNMCVPASCLTNSQWDAHQQHQFKCN